MGELLLDLWAPWPAGRRGTPLGEGHGPFEIARTQTAGLEASPGREHLSDGLEHHAGTGVRRQLAGPIMWMELPFVSTATVTGMSSTFSS